MVSLNLAERATIDANYDCSETWKIQSISNFVFGITVCDYLHIYLLLNREQINQHEWEHKLALCSKSRRLNHCISNNCKFLPF